MTPGAKRVLEELAAHEECDLVQEGRTVYCGNRQTTSRVVNELLNLMAISITSADGFQQTITYYGINDIGQAILRRPELEIEIHRAMYAKERKPFSIVDDQIKFLSTPVRSS